MNYEEVLDRIIQIATEQFTMDGRNIKADTTASDIPSWNSLNHVMLISNIEKAFNIRFDLLEMIEMKSIADIAGSAFKILHRS